MGGLFTLSPPQRTVRARFHAYGSISLLGYGLGGSLIETHPTPPWAEGPLLKTTTPSVGGPGRRSGPPPPFLPHAVVTRLI